MLSKRKGLSPTKVIVIYFLAFLLVSIHEAEDLSRWFKNFAHKSNPNKIWTKSALNISDKLELFAHKSKISNLNKIEQDFFKKFNFIEIGKIEKNNTLDNKQNSDNKIITTKENNIYKNERQINEKHWLTDSFKPLFFNIQEQKIVSIWEPHLNNLAQSIINNIEKSNKLIPAQNILLTGDSMMLEGFGPPLQKTLKEIENNVVSREGKYGTGLVRLDVFDWLQYFDELLVKHKPDLVIITLGANDPQDIVVNKKRHFVGDENWNKIYAQRVGEILKNGAQKNAFVFWVGLPIMGKEPYNQRVLGINKVVEEECLKHPNCYFWDTWDILKNNNDKYDTFLPDTGGKNVRVRGGDNIHLTEAGGLLMTAKFLPILKSKIVFESPLEKSNFTQIAKKEAQPQEDFPAVSENKIKEKTIKTATLNKNRKDFLFNPFFKNSFEKESFVPIKTQKKEKNILSSPLNKPLPKKKAKLSHLIVLSEALNKETKTHLIIPEGELNEKYPIVFLLHGLWENNNSWLDQAGQKLKELSAENNIIIAIPDGGTISWYLDSPIKKDSLFETHFFKELLPATEKILPLLKNKKGICGSSMGGHGAFILSLRNPNTFKAIGSMGGILDITNHHNTPPLKLETVLGEYNEKNLDFWRQHSAYFLAKKNLTQLKNIPILIQVGSSDVLSIDENRKIKELLMGNVDIFQYEESPGGNNWDFWLEKISSQLEFQANVLWQDN